MIKIEISICGNRPVLCYVPKKCVMSFLHSIKRAWDIVYTDRVYHREEHGFLMFVEPKIFQS